MIKTTRKNIFNNTEYVKETVEFGKDNSYVKSVTIKHNGKEVMQYHEGRNRNVFSSVSIKVKDPIANWRKGLSIMVITHILKRWKRKYEYEFEGIDFPDEESLCLFLMELHNEI